MIISRRYVDGTVLTIDGAGTPIGGTDIVPDMSEFEGSHGEPARRTTPEERINNRRTTLPRTAGGRVRR